jgi:stage V sporulation protein D (sporulation-specific penicillin-binding protein)
LAKVNKKVALERIKIKVDKDIADEIRKMNLPGVAIDEDIKRIYPFNSMGSQFLGFVGKDNQGIIGLEAKYDGVLKGESGKILTETDVVGLEAPNGEERRVPPQDGDSLVLTIDSVLQRYAEQTLEKAVKAHNAARGAIIMMDPQNGEILAMANKPDFNLNAPFIINNPELAADWDTFSSERKNVELNKMWRNFSINDTYEPGSTFKIITSAAGLEHGVFTLDSTFSCSGSRTVGGRQIKCWRSPRSHGSQNFVEGIQNSCNPVFMEIGERLGAENFYNYMKLFGFSEKTGIDLPGEAAGIMHKLEKIGPVELATMSFGQSFQITPLQLLRGVSASITGGRLVTPHFGKQIISDGGENKTDLVYPESEPIISEKTSAEMREVLESVVAAGTGNRTYIPGFRIGGKTATSEKLPRRMGKYIASFLSFAPADDPQILTLVLIDEPRAGVYYGGQVAGPIMKEVLENALPHINLEINYDENDLQDKNVGEIILEDYEGLTLTDLKKQMDKLRLKIEVEGNGETVIKQFPAAGEIVNIGTKIIIYTE